MITSRYIFSLVIGTTMLIAVGIQHAFAAAQSSFTSDVAEQPQALESIRATVKIRIQELGSKQTFTASLEDPDQKTQFIRANEAIVKENFIKRVSEIFIKGNSSLAFPSSRKYLLGCGEAGWTPQKRQDELDSAWLMYKTALLKLAEEID